MISLQPWLEGGGASLDKYTFGIIVIVIVAAMQLTAWYIGENGTVFAFTSLIVGLVVGKILDIAVKKKS